MRVFTFEVETKAKKEAIVITPLVEKALEEAGVKNGFVLVHIPHTTASLVLNEGESGLLKDLTGVLDKLVPKGDYEHNRIDNNAEAHIKSAITGSSVAVPLVDGRLLLGTWQDFIFLEHDGPRKRKVVVVFVGD